MENIIGFILPVVIDYVNRYIPNDRVRYVVSVLICMGIAAAFTFRELTAGSVDDFFKSALLIFAQAQTVYRLYWKTASIRSKVVGE